MLNEKRKAVNFSFFAVKLHSSNGGYPIDAMLDIIENPAMDNWLKNELKMNAVRSSATSRSVRGYFPDMVGDGRGNSVWPVHRKTYRDDDWARVTKSLRIADDEIRHAHFTNSYVEQRLNEYHEELKKMKKTSEMFGKKLRELSKIDKEFTKAMSAYLSGERPGAKNAMFRNIARKSKSAECSLPNVCSRCGLFLKERKKSRREYGKFCAVCGAIEMPPQSSVVRCRDCHGEIILQGKCSSCDSLEVCKQLKIKGCGVRSCSNCEYVRTSICDNSQCKTVRLRKEGVIYCRGRYGHCEESSYCSDCELTSSCDASALAHKQKVNMSVDSLVPQSDSDAARSYSCEYEVTSSLSSFEPGASKPVLPPRIDESETSPDEEYGTPRDSLSTEEIKDMLASMEDVSEETNSDDYVDAADTEEPKISKELIVYEPVFGVLTDRLRHAEEALRDVTTGNLKLEEGILTIEEISHQNLELSVAVRDMVKDMADRLKPNQEEEAAENSEDRETFYDIQPPSHCYLCLECGIGLSNHQLTTCPTCDRTLAEIPKSFFEKCSPQPIGSELVPCKKLNMDNSVVAVYPMLVSGNVPRLPCPSVQDRLRMIERETNLLRDNNELINMFVDDFKNKVQHELEIVQSMCHGKGDTGDMAVYGFDVSFYQFFRQITDRRTNGEPVPRPIEEGTCQQKQSFVEMKFEEVFKKENQTALELQIFEQKLEVEGLIIKEKEDFFLCSSGMQSIQDTPSLPLSEMFASANFSAEEKTIARDNFLISIEIELEKEKAKEAIRCEYRANMQKRRLEQEMSARAVAMYPAWIPTRGYIAGEAVKRERSDVSSDDPFFIDIERDDLVEIKSPKYFSSSSDEEEGFDWSRMSERITGCAVFLEAMPAPMHPITEIQPPELLFAVVNVLNTKKEFGRISQIRLNRSPETGVVFLQRKAVSSLSVFDCPTEESLDEFFEAESDMSLPEGRKRSEKSLVRFVPINMAATTFASIPLEGQTLPIVVTDETKPVGNVPELTTALALIREIENAIVEVKLHNAIAILPKLESVLWEHLGKKMKVLKKIPTVSSAELDVFMSALNFLPEGGDSGGGGAESEERLGKIFSLLTGLEEAVREVNASEDGETTCGEPERIYGLLRDLGSKIEDIDGEVDVSAMEDALQLTSELDLAIRENSCDLPEDIDPSDVGDSFIAADTLKSLRKKIFEIVDSEAQQRESRMEANNGRIAKLEKENVEVLRFLGTLLDKTIRRVNEFDNVRVTLVTLRNDIEGFFQRAEEQKSAAKLKKAPTLPMIQEVSSDCSTTDGDMKETLSGMIVALDNLKTKAQKKKEKLEEIFGREKDSKTPTKENLGKGTSSSSELHDVKIEKSRISEFSRIGANTYFMTWTKPTVEAEESPTVGYEIWVDGKVNQRVRNPERLKAVLYSVHPASPGGNFRITLYAVKEDGRRSSLASLKYPEEVG